MAGKQHNLELQYFSTPGWCSLCHDLIWGCKAYACKECNCPFDKKCFNQSKLRKDCGEWKKDTVAVMRPGARREGWMYKQGGNVHNWKKRYFILKDEYLYYFRTDDGDAVAVGSVHLLMAAVKKSVGEFQMQQKKGSDVGKENKGSERDLMFQLITSGRTYYIKTGSDAELNDWIMHLRGSIQCAMDRLSSGKGGETDKRASRLLTLRGQDKNSICADCGDPNPEWASVNIGVFICVSCSGIHRQLGVHISQVRSIVLDAWDEDQIATMENNGNDKVNADLESHLPPGVLKPESSAQLATKELYIRAKYESRSFCSSLGFFFNSNFQFEVRRENE